MIRNSWLTRWVARPTWLAGSRSDKMLHHACSIAQHRPINLIPVRAATESVVPPIDRQETNVPNSTATVSARRPIQL